MEHATPTANPAPAKRYVQLFSSTRRGARLARLMGTQCLAEWGWTYDGEGSRTAALLIGELAANAVLHGSVSTELAGRDFQLDLTLGSPGTLRIGVSDAYGQRQPVAPVAAPSPEEEAGRGLCLVSALADNWGVTQRPPSGKTVWCELDLAGAGR